MNLDQMRSYIRSVVDIDATDITDDTIARMLHEGFDQIVHYRKRWPFFETETTFDTAADDKDYTLAEVGVNITTGLHEIASLRTADHVLQLIGRDEGDVLYPLDSTATSVPYHWTFWGETVRLYPTPNAVTTITVRGYRNPVAFGAESSGSASPDLPEPFQRALTSYGLARAYQQQEDPTMAQQYMGIFGAELDSLAARHDDAPAPQPIVLGSHSSSRWRSQQHPARLRYGWE